MSSTERDDFTPNTKEILAKRVSFCCSNPKCGHITSGPHSDKNKCINIGVAAHIKAAAPGGKRYDPYMTREERMDINNGIWLCQSCSKLIDSDEIKYTVELLHQWKNAAEEKTAKKIASQLTQENQTCKVNEKIFDIDVEDENIVLDILDILMEQIPRLIRDFQLLKFKIIQHDYLDAMTDIEHLRGINYELDGIWIWLNFVLENYEKILSEPNDKFIESEFVLKIVGKTYMMSGDYDGAIIKFSQGNKIQESYCNYYLMLKCYEAKNNEEEQRNILEKLLEFPNKKEITYYELGRFYMYLPKSLEFFSEAIKNNREFSEAHLEKGKVERYYGNWDRAIEDLESYLEISADYRNSQVLLELAMAYYNRGKMENVYLSRWIDNIIITNSDIFLEDGKSTLVMDIGYNYSNIMCLSRKGEYIIVNINEVDIMKVPYKNRAMSGIGLYPSQVNEFLLRYGSNISEEEIKDKASLPALYRIFSNNEEYEGVKQKLLSENVLHMNHITKEYEEYVIENDNISVDIVKRLNSLNAIIRIGNYIIDEWFSATDERFHAFQSKLSQGTMFDEAVVMLVGPEQECQLTFKRERINIRYK
ncbi:tetratricopeptide repeat protein [Lacrimispora sp.]|uniref:tetratricopeptide repeat protein n=1 Tax=Lacrimispora sp. TaxID=2719234 RepID=UPI00285F4FE8|nr:hypothetical protein [Lacrimispora sp.]MDR7812347.1 hypothetical protein [Lacrimispora sp.]